MLYSNAFVYALGGCIFLFLVSVILWAKLIHTKKKFSDMEEALGEIEGGNANLKILASQSDLTAPLAYKINAIVNNYESRIISMNKLDEANKQLMSSLSHDVRTPLTILIGYLDAVHKEIVVGADKETYIETARKKAHDLKDYIDILFDWFKLNSGDLDIVMTPTEVTEFTRTILKDWIPVFEECGLDFNIDFPSSACEIMIDENAYTRIINNLIQNVISHSHASSIEIIMHKMERHIEISICDNGIGISKEDLQHVFERLYKCDKGRSGKGSGLGLSITKQLVEKMGGAISVSSVPNKKTIFMIDFPLSA